MTNFKHTPEPWHVPSYASPFFCDAKDRTVGETCTTLSKGADEQAANASRIVACVNACAGIEDPVALMAALRALHSTDGASAEQRHMIHKALKSNP